MENNFTLTTPILFLIFNRLNTTKRVFEELKKAKPKQLFIAADGPRTKEEKLKTDSVRKYILKNINWNCKVKTLFRKKNLGCKYAVSGAINWFFDNVEQGIILEDDCLPDQSFFRFCQEMLNKYKDDERIMDISGTNTSPEKNSKYSYHFSSITHPWGWATWKRSWKNYDGLMKDFPEFKKKGKIKNLFKEKYIQKYNLDILEKTYMGEIDSWAYVWNFCVWAKNGLVCRPNKNLVKNIGFIKESTHTQNKFDALANLKLDKINFPLIHPKIIRVDKKADKKYYKRYRFYLFYKPFIPLFKKIKLYNFARKIYRSK